MTEITIENVTDLLTEANNAYSEELGCKLSLSADGDVISIAFQPITGEEQEGDAAQHFTAHVFAAEPPAPVATEPVTLDVELAKELTYNGADGGAIDGWKVISIVEGSIRRVERWHHMVIRNEATGAHYQGTFLQGMGDVEYPQAWDEDVPFFEPVEQRVTVVRKVKWVTPTPVEAAS